MSLNKKVASSLKISLVLIFGFITEKLRDLTDTLPHPQRLVLELTRYDCARNRYKLPSYIYDGIYGYLKARPDFANQSQ